MKQNIELKCREKHFHNFALNSTPKHTLCVSFYFRSVLTKLIFLLLPASVYGCSYTEETFGFEEKKHLGTMLNIFEFESQRAIQKNSLDVFAFNDDPLMRLDSYMRLEESDLNEVEMVTQSGSKMMFICANSRKDRYYWTGVDSYHSLKDIHVEIEEESQIYPVLTGECSIEAGSGKACTVNLSPLYAEIVLNSIRCDFTGKAYEGECIRDPQTYLINVNASSSLSASTAKNPQRYINQGFLNQDDLRMFTEPEIIHRKLKEDISSKASHPEIRFLCYPNTAHEDGIGTPYTRLVIEGTLNGERLYWSVNVNRPPDGNGGIERNCRYTYDILIRNKGSDNPDIPVKEGDVTIKMETASWKEKKDYEILF